MKATAFGRLTYRLALEAIAEGVTVDELLKNAVAAVVCAGDPDERVSRMRVDLTTNVRAGELKVDILTDGLRDELVDGPTDPETEGREGSDMRGGELVRE